MLFAVTSDHIDQFNRDGFLKLSGFLSAEDLEELNQRIDAMIRTVVPVLPSEDVFYEIRGKVDTLKQIQRVWHHDAWIAKAKQQDGFLASSPKSNAKGKGLALN